MSQQQASGAKIQPLVPAREQENSKTQKETPLPQAVHGANQMIKKIISEPRAITITKQPKETQIYATDLEKGGKDPEQGAWPALNPNLVPSKVMSGPVMIESGDKSNFDPQSKQLTDQKANQLREHLYESFPEKKSQIKHLFDQFYASKMTINGQAISEAYQVDPIQAQALTGPLESDKPPSVSHAPLSFDILVQKLKEQIGDAEFLSFFKKARSFAEDPLFGDFGQLNRYPSLIQDIHGQEGTQSGHQGQLHPESQVDQFAYSSLESVPEKEFEHAKWVVLTTAQPSYDEEFPEKSRIEKQVSLASEKVNSIGNPNFVHQNNLPAGLIAPQKRYAHSACMAGNKMYIFAGLAQKKGNLQTLYSATLYLDRLQPPSLYRWDKIKTDNPKARDSHTCIYMHDSLIMFGGSSVGKDNSFGDINKFDIKKKAWTKLEAMGDQPPPREAHIAHALGHDKMMIHGGINAQEETFNDTWVLIGLHAELDQMQSQIQRYKNNEKYRSENARLSGRYNPYELEFLRWVKCTQSGQIPESRDSHTSCIINDNIYIFGGQGKGEGMFFNDLYQLKIHPLHSENHVPKFHAEYTLIEITSGPVPPPRTSHSCVSYKNRYLVVIGGENAEISQDKKSQGDDAEHVNNTGQLGGVDQDEEELSDNNNQNPEKLNNSSVNVIQVQSSSSVKPTTQIIKTDAVKNDSVNSEESEDDENESQSQALGDVWVFDTHLRRWLEIKAPLFIQGSGAGKRIRKQFEPRMAHSAVVIDQFVVVFGGLNKETDNLISNDLYVLSLNGVTNALLAKEKTVIPPIEESSKKLTMKKPKLLKPFQKESFSSAIVLDAPALKPSSSVGITNAATPGRGLEDQQSQQESTVVVKEQQQQLQQQPFLEQQERLEVSGHIINSLINYKPGKKINLAQMQREENETYFSEQQKMRDAEIRNNKEYREQEVQTTNTQQDPVTSKTSQNFNLYNSNSIKGHEPEQTRLNHVLSISNSIQSPIAAIATFIDNSVQAFQNQIVDQLNQQRGPPLKIDVSLVKLDSYDSKSNEKCTSGLQNIIQGNNNHNEEQKSILKKSAFPEETKLEYNSGVFREGIINGIRNEHPEMISCRIKRLSLKITDNGPGITPYRMRQTLTHFGQEPLRVGQSGAFDISEHGVGLKIASLRLGQTSLILSKTSPRAQIGIQYLSVALLSTEFVRNQNTPFLVAPLICFTIRDKSSFHQLTEHCEQIFKEIRKYAALSQFSTMEKLMDYALNDMGQHGTHIYIFDLKKTSSNQNQELRRLDNDICMNQQHLYSAQSATSNLALMQPQLAENSLGQFARFMYMRHPQFLQLSINGKRVQNLSNPFNNLLIKSQARKLANKRDSDEWFMQDKTHEFALQLLNPSFYASKHEQGNSKFLVEQGIDRDKLRQIQQGVLLYRGNRLVRRLQGRFGELDEQARIIADIMQEELSCNRNESEVRLGKRTFSQKNADSQRDFLISHLFKHSGIASIFPHASKTSIEKTDFQDRSVIERIKQSIDTIAIHRLQRQFPQ